MAGQIRITPDAMRGRAQEYTAEAQKVEEVIQKMDSLLQSLQDEWEGAASQSFASRFTELRPGFVQAKELIDEISAALNKTAQELESLDNQISSQFRG